MIFFFFLFPFIIQTKEALSSENSVMDVQIPKNGRLVVVGDTHGQLADLLCVLDIADLPSKKNFYIFNGDFVDRGPQGPEVLLILYLLKLYAPGCVFLNRG